MPVADAEPHALLLLLIRKPKVIEINSSEKFRTA